MCTLVDNLSFDMTVTIDDGQIRRMLHYWAVRLQRSTVYFVQVKRVSNVSAATILLKVYHHNILLSRNVTS